ncbi:TVP38/TMEM64 family protein [[Bacteroides] pectinophilus]|nr:TVP38/TMEM64 family protein [[Bacteroides] pectinophilus]
MKNRDRERIWVSKILRVVGWVLVALLILIVFRAWRAGVFTSLDKMEAYIGRFGIWSPFVFIIYQIMQIVVIPFIPGGVTTTAGVVMFGPVEGLILNYIGICLGSIAAFALAKRYGRHLVLRFVDKKKYDRYEERLSQGKQFEIFFAICIFLPFAPDDLLCFLAGLTEMSYKKFITIILLGKLPVIIGYSISLNMISNWLTAIIR